MRAVSVAFVTKTLADNSLGRTFSLWLLAETLGWRSGVFAAFGDTIWAPLRESPFAKSTSLVSPTDISSGKVLHGFDLVIAVKPLPESLGLALPGSKMAGVPILVDVDDPDLEGRLSFERPIRAIAREVVHFRRQNALRAMSRKLSELPIIVSNPVLQRTYGGAIVPHAREPGLAGAPHTSISPSVAFIGTSNPHKGLPQLRSAVEKLSSLGYRLTVTAPEPRDVRPWETWTGPTSFGAGLELVRQSDVVAVPSLDSAFARGQLPAKIIDAMFAARAVVASSIPPVDWALSGTGILVAPGSVGELTAALQKMSDPGVRNVLGTAARQSALSRFSADALAPVFADACRSAIERGRTIRSIEKS